MTLDLFSQGAAQPHSSLSTKHWVELSRQGDMRYDVLLREDPVSIRELWIPVERTVVHREGGDTALRTVRGAGWVFCSLKPLDQHQR